MQPKRAPSGRVALAHDFFVQDGGAERCALALAELLPSARVYTTFFYRERFADRLDPFRVHPWPLQRLFGSTPRFRVFLPLYPLYFSTLDLRSADLVISSSVAFAKAVLTSPRALHISYVYTPLRYAWSLESYLARSSYPRSTRVAARMLKPLLRRWDRWTSVRPDVLVAISETVRDRIRRLWHRDAEVIYPPVDVAEFQGPGTDDGYLLVASRLLSYRRIDIAVEAARALGRELVVVGEGPERARLQRMAGPETRFLGHLPRARLVELFRDCHAYVLPGVEDFGIAPLEAMAAGKPVVAFRRGGALETVQEGRTGVFFDRPDPAALADAIERLDAVAWDPQVLRAHAARFDIAVFRERWRALLAAHGVDASLYSPAP